MSRKRILIVMAAGSGVRMGASVPKQFLDLGGIPVLRRTIEAFVSAVPDIKVVTVLPEDHKPLTPLSLTMPLWRVKMGYPSPSVTGRGITSN